METITTLPPSPSETHSAVSSTEQLESRELLSQQAYARSLENFARVRGEDANFPGVYDPYELTQIGVEGVDKNYNLLVDESEEAAERPSMTICVPVAILSEAPEGIINTLRAVHGSQVASGKPVEVILWTNAKYNDDRDKGEVEQHAAIRYQELRQKLKEENIDGIQLKSALQVLPKEEATISKLRSNYMDALAMEALEKGYGYEHPVMWLDADTTFMSKNTLSEVEQAVKEFDGIFVHPNLQFSLDWAKGENFTDTDSATKAVAISEIHRRQESRVQDENDAFSSYVEESGLAFALGTYLDIGGVNTADPISESPHLLVRAMNKMRIDPGGGIAAYEDGVSVPSFLLDRPDRIPKLFKRIKGARVGTSARRHYDAAKKHGAAALTDPDASGYGTELFTEQERSTAENEAVITAEDLRVSIGENELITDQKIDHSDDRKRFNENRTKYKQRLEYMMNKHLPGNTPD